MGGIFPPFKQLKKNIMIRKHTKLIERLKNEFHQKRYDDKYFAEDYKENEFWVWLKEYEIKTT